MNLRSLTKNSGIYLLLDSLTGLANRRYMDSFLKHEIAVFYRQKTTFGVIFADIDHFKKVNDELGHATGDVVLQEFSEILRKECRETDLAVRYGGEEFLLILPGSNLKQINLLAERLRIKTETCNFSGISSDITASFGIAEITHGDSAESLLERADSKLYEAKTRGRNCCCC